MRRHSWFCSAIFTGLAALLLTVATASERAVAASSVAGVRLGVHPDGVTRLVLDISSTMKFRVSHLDHPYRVVIESDDLAWGAGGGAGAMGAIAGVHYETGRVVVDLSRPAMVKTAFLISPSEGMGWRFVMDVKTTTAQLFLAAVTPPQLQPLHAVQPPVASPAEVTVAPPPIAANIVLPPPAAADIATTLDEQAARTLVQTAITDILGTFAGKTMSPEDTQAAMRRLIASYTDMGLESQQILGRYWTHASPEQRLEFQGLLERFFVRMAAGMVDEISPDQRILVQGAERKEHRVVVHTLASIGNERASDVNWVVMTGSSGKPVITDVSLDGAALITTLQADFTSVVRGAATRSIEALFEPLRKKEADAQIGRIPGNVGDGGHRVN